MITKFNIFLTILADTLSTHSASADAARPWQLMFQDPATPIAEGVMDFHNDLMFVVVFVGIFVGYTSSVFNYIVAMLTQFLTVFNRNTIGNSVDNYTT